MSNYFITKLINPGKGVPCVFRQWSAGSHCRFLHGYDLMFEVTLECRPENLTEEGWVCDFGKFKPLKKRIEEVFDHKLIVADDDPQKDTICELAGFGVAQITCLPHVGIEAFAMWLAVEVGEILANDYERNIPPSIRSTRVYENESNSGGFEPYV